MFTLDLSDAEIMFIGLCLEGLLCGLYSGMFAMYLQYQESKKDTDKSQNIVFYSICALYVLSVPLFVSDMILFAYNQVDLAISIDSALRIYFVDMTLFGLCDFIAQFVLIYRCWIVWGCNTAVVIIPSVLAFAFLVIWLAGGGSMSIVSGELSSPTWSDWVTMSSIALSLTVNALVTSLIVFRIFRVFRQVRPTSNDPVLSATGESKLRRIMLVLIESGIALFSIQLVRFIVSIVETKAALGTFYIVGSIHSMFNGITPTIILVRTSMGLSFHDEKTMEEFAIGSLRFTSSHLNSSTETESIDIVSEDIREDDFGIRRSNSDIER